MHQCTYIRQLVLFLVAVTTIATVLTSFNLFRSRFPSFSVKKLGSTKQLSSYDRQLKYLIEHEHLKYFHEVGYTRELIHYDKRYYHGLLTANERGEYLRLMIQAYLDFFRSHGLETWIAHGTLLGWKWNKKILPWDMDIDTQITMQTMQILQSNYNQTLFDFKIPYKRYMSRIVQANASVTRQYLLDVNPWSKQRLRGDGMNLIDARWIDVRTGLFVDITGLSYTNKSKYPDVVQCKNNHRYHLTDIFPLEETEFEGTKAFVPHNSEFILTQEYGNQSLTRTEYANHIWSPVSNSWIPKSRPSFWDIFGSS